MLSSCLANASPPGWNLAKPRFVAQQHQYPLCNDIPRGGGSGNERGIDDSGDDLKAMVEPVGKSLVALVSSSISFLLYLVSHSVQDAQQHLVVPVSKFISKIAASQSIMVDRQKQNVNEEQQKSQKETRHTTANFGGSLSTIVPQNRILKLSIAGWLVAETLDALQILHVDTPVLLKAQVDRIWYDLQPKVALFVDAAKEWLGTTITIDNISKIPPKYNFAVGASLGMITCPSLSAFAGSIWQPALLLYIIAEINANLGRKTNFSFGQIGNRIGVFIEREILERLRWTIRSIVSDASSSSTSMERALIQVNGGAKDVYTYQKGQVGLPLPKKLVEFKEKTFEHPVISMILHGFTVGLGIAIAMRL